MAIHKKGITTYKRDKNKVEISGEPENVKWQIWFDLISSRLFWVLLVIILLFIVPKASWLPLILQWLKKYILLLTPLVGAEDFLKVLLSG